MRTSVDLHNYLQSHEIPHEISLIEIPTLTTEMAAVSLGLDQSEIGKTLIVEADERPVVVMIPGDRRLDTRKLTRITGARKVRFADAAEVTDITGYLIGSIPPLAHAKKTPFYIDIRLLSIPIIYTCGGQNNAVLKIKPIDLIQAGNAILADLCDDGRV